MLRNTLLVAAIVTGASLAGGAALAQFEGTEQERAACHPDVIRHCKAMIPDTFRILGCLQANRPRLSRACRAVLESHGQ